MANRKTSDAPQHETLPGPGSSQPENGSGVHAVEQMMDAAIDRIARENAEEKEAAREVPPRHALAIRTARPWHSGSLRWKGLDVSDEFRRYAERVAQGEDLPPYAGKILAAPHPTFPWEPSARRQASRRAVGVQLGLWVAASAVAGLLGWSLVVRLESSKSDLREASESSSLTGVPPLPSSAASAREELPGPADEGVHAARIADSLAIAHGPAEESPLPELPDPASATPDRLITPSPARAVAALRAASPGSSPAASAPTRGGGATPRAIASPASEPAPDLAPPGALREALGALLSARAATQEFPSAAGGAGSASASAPVAAASPVAPPSAGAPPPPPAPPEAAGAGPVRKEPGSESSAKGSLLVETPPF